MSIWGNPIMMGGSGGGGGDVPLLTRAQWDALSTAQKQAYGLVAIQDANSGFNRGKLVYGADYIATLLTASAVSSILAEAMCEYYEVGIATWGNLSIVGSSLMEIEADGSVHFNGDEMSAYYDLGAANTPVTNYMVFKSLSSSNTSRLISNVYFNNGGNAPGLYRNGTNIYYTYYGGDNNTGVSAVDGFHCIAVSNDRGGQASKFYVDAVKKGTLTPNNVGRYSEFSTTLQMDGEKYGGNYDIKYMAVVSGAEPEATVIANMQSIMAHYGIL